MVKKLSHEQILKFKEAFDLFDKDGNGCITRKEFATVMRALGEEPLEAELQAIINEVDIDGNGLIDFTKFLNVMICELKAADTEEDLKEAFRAIEEDLKGLNTDLKGLITDIKGLITALDLRQFTTSFGEKLTDEDGNSKFN